MVGGRRTSAHPPFTAWWVAGRGNHAPGTLRDFTVNQRAKWNTVVGTPFSAAAWVQATLPISERGCGVTSVSDVAPVARLAGILQFLARAEPVLDCDRQLVVPLATEQGLLDAFNSPLPPTLDSLESWLRTGKVELPDGEVRRQQW